jgi:hypothetical protein
MSLGYALRRALLEFRLRKVSTAADYCRDLRRDAEAGVHHHDAEAARLRVALAQLHHRADLARLGAHERPRRKPGPDRRAAERFWRP